MAYNPTADRIVIIMNSKSQNYQLGGTHLSDSHPANKLYSDDKGRTWTLCPIANNANNSKYPYFRSVKWIPEADDGNGRFVYLGAENWGQPTGANEILATSGDGINWDSVVIGMNAIAYGPMDIAYSPRDDEWLISVQVRQGHSTTPSTMIRTTDGKFWETPSAPGWAFTTNTWTTNVGAGLNYTQLHWVPELSTNGAWAVGIQYPSNRIRVIPDLDASGTGKYFDTYPVVSSQDQYSLNQFLYSPDEQTFLITTTGYWSNYTPKIWVTSTTSVYSWDEVSLDLNLTEDDSPQFLNCVNNAFSPQLKAFQFYGSQANTPGRKTLSGGVFRDSTVLTLTDTTDLDVLQIGTTMTQNGPTASGGLISINESTPSITISGDGTGWATTNTAYGENIPSGVGVITAFYPTSNIIDFDLVSGGFVANKGRFAQVQEYGYGQNGSHLTFAASDIGKDVSGASNDWGVYNLTASDVTVDSPSDYGSETGGGGEIRSNYCKLNPLSNPLGSDIYANGDLTVDTSGGANNVTAGTLGVSSGKWYWEVTIESGVGVMIGVANFGDTDIRYDQENGLYYYQANGQVYGGLGRSSATSASYGDVCSPGDVIGVALDMDAGTATFYRNNVSQGVANESSLIGKVIGPAIGNGGAASRVTTNFGQKPFQYNAPSGFKTLNTLNLP